MNWFPSTSSPHHLLRNHRSAVKQLSSNSEQKLRGFYFPSEMNLEIGHSCILKGDKERGGCFVLLPSHLLSLAVSHVSLLVCATLDCNHKRSSSFQRCQEKTCGVGISQESQLTTTENGWEEGGLPSSINSWILSAKQAQQVWENLVSTSTNSFLPLPVWRQHRAAHLQERDRCVEAPLT